MTPEEIKASLARTEAAYEGPMYPMDRTQRIAEIARSHAGCSSVVQSALYTDIVIREVDRTPRWLPYYLKNRAMSSCALAVMGALRLAGCTETECVASYLGPPLRDAMADIQTLARRFGAWLPFGAASAMREGDIWIVTDVAGGDAHTGICVKDAATQPDGSVTMLTVEGGQWSGYDSSAISAFARRFVPTPGSARMRLGARYLYGIVDSSKLPVPDSNEQVSDPAA